MCSLVKCPWIPLLFAAACAAQNLVSMEECAHAVAEAEIMLQPHCPCTLCTVQHLGGNGVHGFKNFTIYPCDSDPCVITRGETYNVTFFAEATTSANVVMLSTSVHQQSNATLVQVGQTVSCHFRDFPCNVTKGELFRGSYNFGLSFGTFAPEEVTYWVQVGTYQAMFACGRVKLIVE